MCAGAILEFERAMNFGKLSPKLLCYSCPGLKAGATSIGICSVFSREVFYDDDDTDADECFASYQQQRRLCCTFVTTPLL